MARVATIVPPLRIPAIMYNGVLTPASKWRARMGVRGRVAALRNPLKDS